MFFFSRRTLTIVLALAVVVGQQLYLQQQGSRCRDTGPAGGSSLWTTTTTTTLKNFSISRSSSSSTSSSTSFLCTVDNLVVAIKSGGSSSKYRQRRDLWRQSDCAKSYQNASLQYKFFVGLPLQQPIHPHSHNQGARDNDQEIRLAIALQHEAQEFGDLHVLLLRDVYTELHIKTLHILRWLGSQAKGSLVVVHDDEYCVNLDQLQNICQQETNNSNYSYNIYAGHHLWRGVGYDEQYAFDGSFSPYFTGWLYVLSTDLVEDIVADNDTIFSAIYASHAEDLQVGRWVQKQHHRTDTPPVLYLQRQELLIQVTLPTVGVPSSSLPSSASAAPGQPEERVIIAQGKKKQKKK